MTIFLKAEELLREFKGDAYIHGMGVIDQVGPAVSGLGRKAVLVVDAFPGSARFIQQIHQSLKTSGVEEVAEIKGAHPNAPQEDLYRIAGEIAAVNPDVLVSFGGGSTIDAVKAGGVLWKLGGKIDRYFGTGLVSKALQESGKACLRT